MGASVQVFRQLCIMLLYMLVGYTLYKKKILTEAGSKELAAMLVKIIIPAVIINSFCSEYTPEKAQKIALSALGAALLLGVSILMARLVFPHALCILSRSRKIPLSLMIVRGGSTPYCRPLITHQQGQAGLSTAGACPFI